VYPPDIQTNNTEAWLYYPRRVYRSAYYAAFETVDKALGIVLDGLETVPADVRDNTIVVFFSDQGFKLGEHRLWCIRCLFDADVSTRLMIRDPSKPKSFGRYNYEILDLVDVYPTLVKLATNGKFTAPNGVEGVDQSMFLDNINALPLREYAFSQVPNCNETAPLYRFANSILPTPSWNNVFQGGGR
jgi:iduronate 2-sulfatase